MNCIYINIKTKQTTNYTSTYNSEFIIILANFGFI
jgi:hypothetical protein